MEAGNKLKEAAHGGDPSADRHFAREAMTVSELADLPAGGPGREAEQEGVELGCRRLQHRTPRQAAVGA